VSGTDKWKLLVIGKRAKPWCFKGISMDSLPVPYYANKNAWMTSEIFKKWLMCWDVELQWKSRKILLVFDNCCAPSFRVFEKYLTGVPVSQHHIPGTANGREDHTKFEDLISCNVDKLHP
jgi:hypothetical protein